MSQSPVRYHLTRADLDAFGENTAEAALAIVRKLGWPDAVTMSWLNLIDITYLTTPAAHRDLLVNQPEKFERDPRSGRIFRFIMGRSVFTTEGSEWRRRRKLVQPAFHAVRVNAYAETMATYTAEMVESWAGGETVDIQRAMTDLTMRIIASTMFDVDIQATVDDMADLMETILNVGNQKIQEIVPLPDWWPSPAYRRQRAAVRDLKAILAEIIDRRRASGEDHGDLLSMLLMSKDEDGDTLTDDEALAEAVTLFFAGHETTAVTLMWVFKLLSENPEAEARLHTELDAALAGRLPTLADLPQLPYTKAVVQEAMRLYPAAYSFGRVPTEPVTVDGYDLPPKGIVMLAPYVLHRRPDVFDTPDAFRPARFLPDAPEVPRYAYIPFGAGPRVCLGNSFAALELQLCLAVIASRVSLSFAPGTTIRTQPRVTLHPVAEGQRGLPMVVRRRAMLPQKPNFQTKEMST